MIINVPIIIFKALVVSGFIRIGEGRIKVITTSNTRKITVIRKNRIEKGRREGNAASNPHSKAEGFSREV